MPYRHLVEDPVDDNTWERMRAWTSAHPQNRWGRHVYGMEPFGLAADDVRRRCAEYASRFIADDA